MKNVKVVKINEPVFEFIEVLKKAYKSQFNLEWADLNNALSANKLEDIARSELRKAFYETLISPQGKGIYLKIADAALSALGAAGHHVQIIPTPRVHFPGARSASFHTDGWYGHSKATRTIWVPFTELDAQCALHFCDQDDFSKSLEADAQTKMLDIYEIDSICQATAKPAICEVGEALVFSSDILHGSIQNNSSKIRLSFDFRIANPELGYGSKSSGNFRVNGGKDAEQKSDIRIGLKYITTAFSKPLAISGAVQHAAVDDYAKRMSINLSAAEAEIEVMDYGPTLLGYAKSIQGPKDIVMFSTASLPRNQQGLKKILDACILNGVRLHFAAEQLIFPTTVAQDALLEKVASF